MTMQLNLADVDKSTPVEKQSAFERFKAAYPKRDGANPWQPARVKFETLVKRGVDAEMIIRGARQLAVEMHATKQIGSRFVPQAITWLNQQRYADMEGYTRANNPEGERVAEEKFWEQVLTSYTKFGLWSKWAGPSPDSLSCRCPRELLLKHGIVTEAVE